MVPARDFLAFAGVVVVLVAVPGPSVAFTISRALTYGRRVALLNVAGNTLGLVAQVVAVAFGLGTVIERSAEVFSALKLAGAAYLVWLGVQAIRHRRSLAEAVAAQVGPLPPLRAVRDGVVVGATNPKTIAVFVVVMPQFTTPGSGHLAAQLLVLGLVFPLIALVLDSCWGLAAGTARQWLSGSPRRLAAIGGAGGLVMIGLGVSLAATGRKDCRSRSTILQRTAPDGLPWQAGGVEELRLPGGNAGGAVLVDGTVRRPTGQWTPAVHALLEHLEAKGFAAPRVLGVDDRGREILSYLPGSTVGLARPWPAWVHSDEALVQVGARLRRYHYAVADFVPAPEARWRTSLRPWRPGDIVGHNDAAPYNAVWEADPPGNGISAAGTGTPGGRLVGFIDWDFAAPCPSLWDLAFVVFSWVPLHARDVVTAEGFTDFVDRPRRLHLLLDAYGYAGSVQSVLEAVHARIVEHAQGLRELAAAGDPLFSRLVDDGVIDGLDRALAQLREDATTFERNA